MFEPATRTLRFASAGHPHPFHWSRRHGAGRPSSRATACRSGLVAGSRLRGALRRAGAGRRRHAVHRRARRGARPAAAPCTASTACATTSLAIASSHGERRRPAARRARLDARRSSRTREPRRRRHGRDAGRTRRASTSSSDPASGAGWRTCDHGSLIAHLPSTVCSALRRRPSDLPVRERRAPRCSPTSPASPRSPRRSRACSGRGGGRGADPPPQPRLRRRHRRVHRHGGSVVDFSGDAIMCWFDDPAAGSGAPGAWRAGARPRPHLQAGRGVGCGAAARRRRRSTLSLKVAVGAGARRCAPSSAIPRCAWSTSSSAAPPSRRTAADERRAPGEVVIVDATAVEVLGARRRGRVARRRRGPTGRARLASIVDPGPPTPWPTIGGTAAADAFGRGSCTAARTATTTGSPSCARRVALFVRFAELDFDGDPDRRARSTATCAGSRASPGPPRRDAHPGDHRRQGRATSTWRSARRSPTRTSPTARSPARWTCATRRRDDALVVRAAAMGLDQGVARTGVYGGLAASHLRGHRRRHQRRRRA